MKRCWSVILVVLMAVVWNNDASARAHAHRSSASHRTTHGAKSPAKPKPKPAAKTTRHVISAPEPVETDVEEIDEDFEQSAAEWREWLHEREEERRHNGESMDDMAPDMADQSWPDLDQSLPSSRDSRATGSRSYRSLRGKNGRVPEKLTGRRRYILDPNRPLDLMLSPSHPVDLRDLSNLEFYDPTKHAVRGSPKSKSPPSRRHSSPPPPKPQSDKPKVPTKKPTGKRDEKRKL